MTVKQQQLILAYLGYYLGEIDGISGSATRAAIRAFQRAESLTVDAVWGPKTEAAAKDAVMHDRFRQDTAPTVAPSSGNFWDDIKYFTRAEFRCPCPRCGGFPAEPREKLVRLADRVRAAAGAKATVSSGVRCKARNAEVGGAGNSRHLCGQAIDFCIEGLSSTQLLQLVRQQKDVAYAYAIDDRYVHMDVT